jgi:hypothetical protein
MPPGRKRRQFFSAATAADESSSVNSESGNQMFNAFVDKKGPPIRGKK